MDIYIQFDIYIWVFSINFESVLLLALVKYMLCSHFTENCTSFYFLEAKIPYFVKKNCWKSSYICLFILSKKWINWFHKNLHNSGMVGRRKLPDPSLNHIFNALLIGYNIRSYFNELILAWSAYLKADSRLGWPKKFLNVLELYSP